MLFGIPSCFLGITLAYPVYWIARLSFGYPDLGFRAFAELAASTAHLRVVGQTLTMALSATGLALVLGYPVAYLAWKMKPRWRQVLLCIITLPLWTSLLVRTYAWMILLAPNGPINSGLLKLGLITGPLDLAFSRLGAVIGLTHSVLPYLILPIYASLLRVEGGLLRAGHSLGASRAQTFFGVVLPLTVPGIATGCLFAFLLGLGAFVIPALLGSPAERTIAMMIESTANHQLDWNLAAAIAIELLCVSLLLIGVQQRTIGLGSLQADGEPSPARTGRLLRPFLRICFLLIRVAKGEQRETAPARAARARTSNDRIGALTVAVAVAALVFLALPLVIVLPVSFSSSEYLQFPPPSWSLKWYLRYLTDTRWLQATGLSVVIGVAVVCLSFSVGSLAALIVARSRSRLRGVIASACLAPMLIPNMVMALGFFFAFSRLHLVGTVTGLVLAHSLLALPFTYLTISIGLREISRDIEHAAAVAGAGPFTIARRIMAPLLIPFFVTAALFAFIISFDEIVSALFLTSVAVRTLPKMMWENIVMFMDPTISAVSVILIFVTSVIVIGAQALQSRDRGRPSREGWCADERPNFQ